MPEFEASDLHFVMGADLLASLHTWHQAEEFKKEVSFIIFQREGFDGKIDPSILPEVHVLVEGVFTGMSSTKIRKRIETVRTTQPHNPTLGVLGLVTERVKQYIRDKSLYCS